jgi:hypothetical protein
MRGGENESDKEPRQTGANLADHAAAGGAALGLDEAAQMLHVAVPPDRARVLHAAVEHPARVADRGSNEGRGGNRRESKARKETRAFHNESEQGVTRRLSHDEREKKSMDNTLTRRWMP